MSKSGDDHTQEHYKNFDYRVLRNHPEITCPFFDYNFSSEQSNQKHKDLFAGKDEKPSQLNPSLPMCRVSGKSHRKLGEAA